MSSSCLTARRPTYVLTNVALPMCILTLLALLQFLLPGHHDAAGVRITFTVTILLTSATYKLFVSTALPAVGYLTLCDKYVLACFMLQAAVVAEGAIMGAVALAPLDPQSTLAAVAPWVTSDADWVAGVMCCAAYVVSHAYFGVRAYWVRRTELRQALRGFVARAPDAGGDADSAFSSYRQRATTTSTKDEATATAKRRGSSRILGNSRASRADMVLSA